MSLLLAKIIVRLFFSAMIGIHVYAFIVGGWPAIKMAATVYGALLGGLGLFLLIVNAFLTLAERKKGE